MRRTALALTVLALVCTGTVQALATHEDTSSFHYVTVSDGEEIAVQVFLPPDHVDGQRYPVLFTTEGYGGAGGHNDSTYNHDHDGYVLVAASLRGTGCSGGQLDLFDPRSSLDGAEIIEDWLPTQDWYDPTATSTDVDFWVEVLDVDLATGATTFVQRGLQRASFRETDDSRAARVRQGGPHAGEVYRPYRDFMGPEPIVPGEAYEYQIEVFPFGHVFRPGHAMVVQVHAPPTNDPISTYAYEPNQASVVTILQDPSHRSSILLPFLPGLPPMRAEAPACDEVVGEICLTSGG